MPFLPLNHLKQFYDQGYRYQLEIINRNCPTHIELGRRIEYFKSVKGAKQYVEDHKDSGMNEYQVYEIIFPWDSWWEQVVKRIHGCLFRWDAVHESYALQRKYISSIKTGSAEDYPEYDPIPGTTPCKKPETYPVKRGMRVRFLRAEKYE
jgi:hypothetical protein